MHGFWSSCFCWHRYLDWIGVEEHEKAMMEQWNDTRFLYILQHQSEWKILYAPQKRENSIFNAMVLRVLSLAIENSFKYQRSILRPENAPKHLQIIAFSASQPYSLLSNGQEQPISHISQSRLDHSTISDLSINTCNPNLDSFRPLVRRLLQTWKSS